MTVRRLFGSVVFGFVVLAATPAPATFRDGMAALGRHDYVAAVGWFGPLAEAGNPKAQAILGYLYATGHGVPQNYVEAARWYRRASVQGNATAQFMLGLMYDKGQGVPQDYVIAYMWLDLAVGRATGRTRQDWVRIRDAVASKLSLAELTLGQRLALEFRPVSELWLGSPPQ